LRQLYATQCWIDFLGNNYPAMPFLSPLQIIWILQMNGAYFNASPLFSIITVALNCREDALKTVRSVHEQACSDYEHIVKDGGSADGTAEAVHNLAPSTDIVVSRDNGIYHAMNQALEHVHGTYVHFLNAGDFYSEASSLEQLSAGIIANGYPDMLACYVKTTSTHETYYLPSSPSKYFLYRHGFCHQAVLFKRDLFHKYDVFDATLKLRADHDFIYRCLIQGRCSLAIVPMVLVNYAGGGISDGAKANAQLDQERRIVLRRHFTLPSRMLFSIMQAATLWRLRRHVMQGNNSRLKSLLSAISQRFNRA
jgi:glycosyltransferase involved in cell wall biosynthesis